jgi:cytochrome bd-type quinol oxidase subunit 2
LLPILGVLFALLIAVGVARYRSASAQQRSALSVVLVVLGLLAAFFVFFAAGSMLRGHKPQPRPHAGTALGGDGPSPAHRAATRGSGNVQPIEPIGPG